MSAEIVHLPPVPAFVQPLSDDRYRNLLGETAWRRLPADIRRRFSRHLASGEQIVYRGEVVGMALSRFGRLLAQLARIVGAPLPFTDGAVGPSVVVVTEDERMGGQVWSRCYPRPGRFPQIVQSAKRFAGPTGLEEYLGFGLLMRLALVEEDGGLVFRSKSYALCIGRSNVTLPRFLTPGRCTVTHRSETDARFSFTLTLDHPWLGRLVHQVAFYDDP